MWNFIKEACQGQMFLNLPFGNLLMGPVKVRSLSAGLTCNQVLPTVYQAYSKVTFVWGYWQIPRNFGHQFANLLQNNLCLMYLSDSSQFCHQLPNLLQNNLCLMCLSDSSKFCPQLPNLPQNYICKRWKSDSSQFCPQIAKLTTK